MTQQTRRAGLRWKVSVILALSVSLLGLVSASQTAFATSRPLPSITTGSYNTCALESGRAYCWGPNSNGQLGDGSTTGSSSGIPVAVTTTGVLAGKTLAQITAGDGFACALDTAGVAYCWGGNEDGELGDGSLVSHSPVPVPVDTRGVLAGKKLTQIAAGQEQVCVLDSAGRAYCWGENHFGELGDASTANSNVPVAVSTSGALAGKKITQLAGGEDFDCALDSAGTAYCWGADDFGQLGDAGAAGPATDVPVAVDASGALAGKKLTDLAANQSAPNTCALDAGGSAYCWGINADGELGEDATGNSGVPVAVDAGGALAGKTLTQISTGAAEGCALDNAGRAYCWGGNFYGELGDGSAGAVSLPVPVRTGGALAGRTLTQISAGGDFWTCATDSSGAVYCWGDNSYGQFGDSGTASQSAVPVQAGPAAPTGVTAVSGSRSARVAWQAPAISGGALTGYTAFASPGRKICITKATSCVIKGLANETTYSVTVVAHTAVTNSAASAPAFVTPGSGVRFTSDRFVTAAFGVGFRFTISAKGGSPAPKITMTGRLPSGVTFRDGAGGTATVAGKPTGPAAGVYRLTLTAKSKAGTATQVLALTVSRAPALKGIPAATGKIRKAIKLPIAATGYPVPELTESGRLPNGVRLTDNGNGTGAITGIPARGSSGTYRITVIAASTDGTATRTFTLSVDQPPAITSAPSATAVIGYTLFLPVTATGYPAPAITEHGALPGGVTFKSATASLGGIPRAGTGGRYKITFTARNAAGTTTQDFTLTVT